MKPSKVTQHSHGETGEPPIIQTAEGTGTTPKELVKQLATYADAITAFSFAQSLALVFAIAKIDDFSKRVVKDGAGAWATTVGIIGGTIFFALLVHYCARLASKLETPQAVVAQVLRSIQTARFLVMTLGGLLSIVALWLIKTHPLP